MRRSRDYQRAFIEQNYDIRDEDRMFLPCKRVKHRHPELSSATVEGREQIATYGLAATKAKKLQPKKFNSNCKNTPILCFLQGFKISICYGYKTSLPHNRKPLMT